jgi:hypothetical protein
VNQTRIRLVSENRIRRSKMPFKSSGIVVR